MAKIIEKKTPVASTTRVTAAAPKKRPKKSNKSYIVALALVLVIGAGAFAGYRVYDNQRQEISRLSNPQESAKVETERIKQQVAKLIELPADEDPTIATVVDPDKLSNQPFFAKAQKDDRVVMYAKAKKAVLYRPSSNKIIEVAPINIGDPKAPAQTAPAAGGSESFGQPSFETTP
ncbi:MAG: hypothetical protein ACR2FM_00245 [Candidatus Saccharimonadales bacterium]